jgi:hypothetical protein
MRIARRRFLQVGVAGAAVLVAARWLERAAPDGEIVAALAPVVLADALPAAPAERAAAIARVVESVEGAILGLAPAAQREVRELFALLRFAPTRLATTGLWKPLPEAAPGDIASFLVRWRDSRFDLLRAGYQGLTQLVQAGWYDDPRSWAAVGYPGPPQL